MARAKLKRFSKFREVQAEIEKSGSAMFRDANSVRWVRMPDGALKEQSAATARDSILAIALGG